MRNAKTNAFLISQQHSDSSRFAARYRLQTTAVTISLHTSENHDLDNELAISRATKLFSTIVIATSRPYTHVRLAVLRDNFEINATRPPSIASSRGSSLEARENVPRRLSFHQYFPQYAVAPLEIIVDDDDIERSRFGVLDFSNRGVESCAHRRVGFGASAGQAGAERGEGRRGDEDV